MKNKKGTRTTRSQPQLQPRTFTDQLNASEDTLNRNAKGFRPVPGKTTSRPLTGGKWVPA